MAASLTRSALAPPIPPDPRPPAWETCLDLDLNLDLDLDFDLEGDSSVPRTRTRTMSRSKSKTRWAGPCVYFVLGPHPAGWHPRGALARGERAAACATLPRDKPVCVTTLST